MKTKSTDWRVKIKDVCPCFVSELEKATPTHDPCPVKCPLEDLKILLLQHQRPTRKAISKAMIKSGIFKQREIEFALIQIHNTIFKSAERRVEEAIVDLKKEGYKVITDDERIIKAWKEKTDEQSLGS